MVVCNACRYCEGYCAVFRAMEKRRSFPPGDLRYLANLCHDCGECLYACQYAPPHEFAINVPRTFAQLRLESYETYAWPAPLSRAFRRNSAVTSLALGCSDGWRDMAAGDHDGKPGAAAGEGRLLRNPPAPRDGGALRGGIRVCAHRARCGARQVPSRYGDSTKCVAGSKRTRPTRVGAGRARRARRADPQEPPRARRRLHVRWRGVAIVLAAVVSPLHVLWIRALLCRNVRSGDVSLAGMAGALQLRQPAGRPRHGRRFRASNRSRRPVFDRSPARSGCCGSRRSVPRTWAHRPAVSQQPDRPGAPRLS